MCLPMAQPLAVAAYRPNKGEQDANRFWHINGLRVASQGSLWGDSERFGTDRVRPRPSAGPILRQSSKRRALRKAPLRFHHRSEGCFSNTSSFGSTSSQ